MQSRLQNHHQNKILVHKLFEFNLERQENTVLKVKYLAVELYGLGNLLVHSLNCSIASL